MLIVTTAATVEPVTLAEAKAHLRVTDSSSDTLIGALISAAREAVEQNTGRALAAAEYRFASNEAMTLETRLPLWPVDAVSAVSYEDADGVRQAVGSGDYVLDADRSLLVLDALPDYGVRMSVTFTVDPQDIPVAIKQSILLLVGDMYENAEGTIRADSAAVNPVLDRLLTPYRVNFGL